MRHPDPSAWMLAEAVELLQTADRLQRQFFQIGQPGESPNWEPPVDMYVNGRLVAKGEIVVVTETLAFRITDILSTEVES